MNYTESDVDAAFEQAPELVQNALSGGLATDFIVAAQTRYDLHIDVAGQLAHMVRDMLVGLLLPAEFYDGLVRLGIEQRTAQNILTDVNAEVFLPLRSEMQKQGITQTVPERAPAKVETPREPLVPVPAPIPTSVWPTPAAAQVMQAPVPPVQETHMVTAAPQETQPYYPQPVQPQWPGHPGPNWQPAAAVHVYIPTGVPQYVPQAPPAFQSMPTHTVEPVERAPVPAPVATSPQYQDIAEQAVKAPPVPRPQPPLPVNLPGAPRPNAPTGPHHESDPYREPIQ